MSDNFCWTALRAFLEGFLAKTRSGSNVAAAPKGTTTVGGEIPPAVTVGQPSKQNPR